MLLRVTLGFSPRTRRRTGSRELATSAPKIPARARCRRSAQPGFCLLIRGRRLRRTSRASTGLRSNRFATPATYRTVSGRFTFTRSFTAVPGGTVSARATAGLTWETAPRRAGSTRSRWRRTSSRSGRAKAVLTASIASPADMSPTSTPPIVTPEAITDSGTVVVPVVAVVVVETTPADTPPAAARPSTNSNARPAPFTDKSLALKDPGIVGDQSVDPERVEPAHLVGVEDRPGEHGCVERVTALYDGSRDHVPVEHRGVRVRRREHAPDAAGQHAAHRGQSRAHERLDPAADPESILRVCQPPAEARLEIRKRTQAGCAEGAHERALDEAMAPERLDNPSPGAGSLEVDLGAGLGPREERKRLVERREVGRDLRRRMGEDKRSVELEYVELDQVAAELQRERERRDRVLRRERSRTAVPDPQQPPFTAPQVDHRRLITTTARSSPSSPAKARQSSTSACASSCAGSSAPPSSAASSRSSP